MTPWTLIGMQPACLQKTYETFPHYKHTMYRNHKTELSFSLQLIADKHTMTILTRTRQPKEQSNTRLIPRANQGLSKSCQCCQTYLKFILKCVSEITQHRLNPTQPNPWCDFMRLRRRLHCLNCGSSLAERL